MERFAAADRLRKIMCGTVSALLALTLAAIGLMSPGKASAAATGTVTTVGWEDSITEYGWTQKTSYMEVNGRFALCCQHFSATPALGAMAVEIDSNVANDNMRKVAWYGYGGPGSLGTLSLVQTACALSNANGDSLTTTGQVALNSLIGLDSPPSTFALQKWSTGGVTQDLITWTYNPNGALEIDKDSSNPSITDGNSCYSLAGAVYEAYGDWNSANDRANAVASLVTNGDGWARIDEIPAGNYFVREKTAPSGYALDDAIYPVNVPSNATGYVNGGKVHDVPQNDPAAMWVGKIDLDTTLNMPQGSASLEGAEFTVRYYDGQYTTVADAEASGAATRTWVVKTTDEGKAALLDSLKVSGDEFYHNGVGEVIIPLGTLLIQETKAPVGYVLDDTTVYVRQVTSEGNVESVETYDTPIQKEQVAKGDIALMKYGETQTNPDNDPTLKVPLAGVKFEIVNKGAAAVISPTGDSVGPDGVVCSITTDAQGWASTESLRTEGSSGSLAYSAYEVREVASTTPAGYRPVESFTVNVTDNGTVLRYMLEDKTGTAIKVVKQDSGTDKIVAGTTRFRILDKDQNPITFTSYYPQTTVQTEFTTTSQGACVLPEKLMAGNYYLQEVEAPWGYLLDSALIPFTVDSSTVGTFLNPLVVIMKDDPAMGSISLTKTDAETQKAVLRPGAAFEVRASSDIVTNDGTVRATRGELVDTLVTDAKGQAESQPLYLGTYTITETSAPDGYILAEASTTVTLTYKDGVTPVTVNSASVSNAPAKGVVEVDKRDADTGKPVKVSGIEFDVIANADIVTGDGTVRAHAGDKVAHLSTNADGIATSPELYLGTYDIVETKAPQGYLLSTEKATVTLSYVDQKTPLVSAKATVSDKVQRGIIAVTKVDAETGSTIEREGTTFEVIAKNDIATPDGTVKAKAGEVVATIATDKTGVARTGELYLGNYLIKETKAPDGWVLSENTMEVSLLYNAEATGNVEAAVIAKDKQTEIKLIKTDEENGASLEGAEFTWWKDSAEDPSDYNNYGSIEITLKDPDQYVAEMYLKAKEPITTIDKDGNEVMLFDKGARAATFQISADGKYHAAAPAGSYYVALTLAASPWTTTSALAVLSENTALGYTLIADKASQAISANSYDVPTSPSDKDKESDQSQKTATVTTDSTGTIVLRNLPAGTYVFQETKAPTGYMLDNSLHYVTIDETGHVDGEEIGLLNLTNKKTEIVVNKLDADTKMQVSGALLGIKDAAGKWVDLGQYLGQENVNNVEDSKPTSEGAEEANEPTTKGTDESITAMTTTDAAVTVKGLPVGEYSLVELAAPEHYAMAANVSFDVPQSGTGVVTMYDEYLGAPLDETGADAPFNWLLPSVFAIVGGTVVIAMLLARKSTI